MSDEVDQQERSVSGRLQAVLDLIEFAGRLPPSTAVVPGGHRVEDLRLVESARDHGIVDRIVLVGDRDRVSSAVHEVGIEIAPADIVPAAGDDQVAAATVELIKDGTADIVLKGDISTPVMNRHMLPLAERSTVSLATVFDAAPIADGRPMVMSDPGVTTVCNLGRMADLVRNSVDVAHVLGIDRPRVAVLSANEKQVPSLPSTRIGLELARRTWPDAIVCGPLSFDLATDPGSVAIKGMPDLPGAQEVAGRADVLVCPGIDAANVLYKTIAAMNKFGQASLASITVGFPVPYVILSRSDSLETRLVSIALCTVYAQHQSSLVKHRATEGNALSVKDASLIVAHLGERTMVAAFRQGKIVDVCSPVVKTDRPVSQNPVGDHPADSAFDELIHTVAGEIGRVYVAAGCDVEAIVLTGERSRDNRIRGTLRSRVSRLAPVTVMQGCADLDSLVAIAVDALSGNRKAGGDSTGQ